MVSRAWTSRAEIKKAPEQMARVADEAEAEFTILMTELPMPILFGVGNPSTEGASALNDDTQVKSDKEREVIAPGAS